MDEALLDADLEELMCRASAIRDEHHGNAVTYSPKVFIPLTRLCRDSCSYCTFAKPPAKVDAPYLSRDEVLRIAESGRESGCSEALFTLGERPELRYQVASEWLEAHGYASTIEYLMHMCAAVRDETGLLPHANAGALDHHELSMLRSVSASQGMMLETMREDIEAHRLAPDKEPRRRLQTLEAAGRLSIPFTTGILVGIGEDANDWLVALDAIGACHGRHGHIGEVIIQNFVPKARTGMSSWSPATEAEHLRAIALARIVLPPDIHVQAPPNLTRDFGRLLDAGVDDWGGISPVTPDHVNPDQPWPVIERLREVAEARGFQLRARLPIHEEFHHERWIDDAMRPSIDALHARLGAS